MEEENIGNKSRCTEAMEAPALHVTRTSPQKRFASFTQDDE